MSNPSDIFANSQRIVIKIGSSLLVDQAGVRHEWLARLAQDIAHHKTAGREIIIVSSGAVAIGRKRLKLTGVLKLEEKQAAAAAGQAFLIEAWQKALAPHDLVTAQLLLTLETTADRRSYLNARSTLDTLLSLGAIPIINENDTIATSEIRYGDNDRLAAHAAQMAGADMLVLLSDVDGLYTANPNQNRDAQHIPIVSTITTDIEAYAGKAEETGVGSGGMITKLAAAKIAAQAGCATVIALGNYAPSEISDEEFRKHGKGPLAALFAGGKSTVFLANESPQSARKNWISSGLTPKGKLLIDAGATKALQKGASLLPAGVTRVEGQFARGDLVEIFHNHEVIARGLAAYDSEEARKITGAQTDEVEARLGYARRPALVHRDDLVVM